LELKIKQKSFKFIFNNLKFISNLFTMFLYRKGKWVKLCFEKGPKNKRRRYKRVRFVRLRWFFRKKNLYKKEFNKWKNGIRRDFFDFSEEEKEENRFIKFPMLLHNLNFLHFDFISLNKDLAYNPLFKGLSRGFPKGLRHVGIKEFNNNFLRPRWYRLAKFDAFKKLILLKEQKFKFFLNYKRDHLFLFSILKKEDFKFIFYYFIRKRWDLLNVLQ